jgi:hypothetical protein
MAGVVFMAMEFIDTRVRLDESAVRQASLAKHSAVGNPTLIGTDMTACDSGGDAIGIDPPGRFSLDPIVRLELDGPRRTRNTLCTNGRLARFFRASESQ